METKACIKCGIEKPYTEEWFIRKSGRSRPSSICKECERKRLREYKRSNKELMRKQRKKYRENNKDRIKEKSREYVRKNKDRLTEYAKCYRENRKEKRSETMYKYIESNKEKILAYKKLYRIKNRDKIREYDQTKRSTPEGRMQRIKNQQARLARKRVLQNDFDLNHWGSCKSFFNHQCAYCGTSDVKLQQEHFIPLSKGGEYTVNNIVPSCRRCNNSKHAKDFFKWYRNQPHYSKVREEKILKYLNYKNEDVQQLALTTW